MCGEQPFAEDVVIANCGSAPRVRGTVYNKRPWRINRRFSPACAGNSQAGGGARWSPAVQPRVCGEQCWRPYCRWMRRGSAPRVRGTGVGTSCAGSCCRFSPACAGNRYLIAFLMKSWAVQPRVCGEQRWGGAGGGVVNGSAPRVRGTVLAEVASTIDRRISPACAGNSCPERKASALETVQPRVCGEQELARLNALADRLVAGDELADKETLVLVQQRWQPSPTPFNRLRLPKLGW